MPLRTRYSATSVARVCRSWPSPRDGRIDAHVLPKPGHDGETLAHRVDGIEKGLFVFLQIRLYRGETLHHGEEPHEVPKDPAALTLTSSGTSGFFFWA